MDKIKGVDDWRECERKCSSNNNCFAWTWDTAKIVYTDSTAVCVLWDKEATIALGIFPAWI